MFPLGEPAIAGKIRGIYIIKCEGDNKTYIGQSVNIRNRLREHVRELIKGKHSNNKMQHAYNKYGIDSFNADVVEVINSKSVNMYDREDYWAKYYNCFEEGFNLSPIRRKTINMEEFAAKVRSDKNGNVKLKENDVLKICELLNEGKISDTSIGKMFNVSYKTIASIRIGRTWDYLTRNYLSDNILIKWDEKRLA